MRWLASLRPAQQLVLGFVLYAAVGWGALMLSWSQQAATGWLDNLFNVVSAISTTGLTTTSVSDSYTWLGELVILVLFQLGGIGFMTLTSVMLVARGQPLSRKRLGVLHASFALPRYFVMKHFVVQVVTYTLVCEAVGAGVLWWRFHALGTERPVWSAVFHSVSAFATAGFSLNNSSLEAFAGDWIVNVTIGVLSYLGAIGFIVAQDVWYSVKLRERLITFTSKVILVMTGAVFVIGTVLLLFMEPSVRGLPWGDRLLACMFQAMTASTTAGFNTIPIGPMARGALVVLMIAMLIGASPSGTGGGIKTTSVSALLGNLMSVLRGRDRAVWMGHEIPPARLHIAVAAASLYLIGLALGVLALCVTERHEFLPLVFEAASAIGTVGLSMGITGELTPAGKVIVIVLMFAGRCGPLTMGLALLSPVRTNGQPRQDDLAV
ncbi:MAG: K+ transporter Trk [Phycisphaerae bacterium]|nr:MAG: K+ transporter Trk [Phycisphaerae bacterium]